MTWKTLFFSFEGRIGRQQWWMAMLALLATSSMLTFLVDPYPWFSRTAANAAPNAAATLLNLAFLIPETAVTVKRFNDRDWPNFLPYGYALVFLAVLVLDHNHLILRHEVPTPLDITFMTSLLAVVVAIVIDNGMLRGTVGPNRYGPDPLQAEADSDLPPAPTRSRP